MFISQSQKVLTSGWTILDLSTKRAKSQQGVGGKTGQHVLGFTSAAVTGWTLGFWDADFFPSKIAGGCPKTWPKTLGITHKTGHNSH